MKYLITGNAGSGKSSVAEALQAKGLLAVDADQQPYSQWVEHSTGKTFSSRPHQTPNWHDYFEWAWDEPEIQKLLDTYNQREIFLCGIASNQEKFYALFYKIFLLDIDNKTLEHRLTTRTNNPFGKRPGDLEVALWHQEKLRTNLQKLGAITIDATQPLEIVVDEILANIK